MQLILVEVAMFSECCVVVTPAVFALACPEQQALRQSLLFMLMKLLLGLLHLVTASPLVPGFGSAGGRHLQECAACPGLADYIQALAADFFFREAHKYA